jgi:hypothetical protein
VRNLALDVIDDAQCPLLLGHAGERLNDLLVEQRAGGEQEQRQHEDDGDRGAGFQDVAGGRGQDAGRGDRHPLHARLLRGLGQRFQLMREIRHPFERPPERRQPLGKLLADRIGVVDQVDDRAAEQIAGGDENEDRQQHQQRRRHHFRNPVFSQEAHDWRQRQRQQEGKHHRHEEGAGEIERGGRHQNEDPDHQRPHQAHVRPGIGTQVRAFGSACARSDLFGFHRFPCKPPADNECMAGLCPKRGSSGQGSKSRLSRHPEAGFERVARQAAGAGAVLAVSLRTSGATLVP